MRNIPIITALIFLIPCARSQSSIPDVLAEIGKNNKTIQASKQYYEVKKIQSRTSNIPDDPFVDYEFLIGSPNSAGNQHDFTIMQQIDFPSTYFKRAQLIKLQDAQTVFELNRIRQDILLQANQYCIGLIHQNKLRQELTRQKQYTEKLLQDLNTKLEKGDANILDVNKAKLSLIDINQQLQQINSAITQYTGHLTALNGGTPVVFTDSSYQPLPELPGFEQLEADYESVDPIRKSIEQQKLITQKQLELSKALWLPKIEAGYHYQGILGQTYNGIHTGISIPIWENKNTIKLQKLQLAYDDLNLQDHRNEHYQEIKRLYDRYTSLKNTLTEYESVFFTINSSQLLKKAVELGQISTIEYFLELSFFNSAWKNYLVTEKELQEVAAELYKYKL